MSIPRPQNKIITDLINNVIVHSTGDESAQNDKNKYVRMAAIRHPNVSPENISKALKDTDASLRTLASTRNREISTTNESTKITFSQLIENLHRV
jgi:hypothetical protein